VSRVTSKNPSRDEIKFGYVNPSATRYTDTWVSAQNQRAQQRMAEKHSSLPCCVYITHIPADSETVTLDPPHAPHAAALEAFAFAEQTIKHAYVISQFYLCRTKPESTRMHTILSMTSSIEIYSNSLERITLAWHIC
jgi:hypothetical protein